jgi:hypothetical protein
MQKDKLLHLSAGAIISVGTFIILYFFNTSIWLDTFINLYCVAVAGSVKEFADSQHGVKPDWKDWIATFIGGLFCCIIHIVCWNLRT